MTEKETFTEQTLKRIRSGEPPPAVKKKRTLSRAVLVIDAIVIILVLAFLNSRGSKNENVSAIIETDGLTVRFSVNKAGELDAYLMSLSLTSSLDREKTWHFEKSAATIRLAHKNNVFFEDEISKNTSQITILPGETRTFSIMVRTEIIDDYLKTSMPKKRRTIVDAFVSGETITAEVVLNLPEKPTLIASFEQEDK